MTSNAPRRSATAAPPAPYAGVRRAGGVFDGMRDTVGATPLVRLSRLAQAYGAEAEILGKLEFFNPAASVKDRIGVSMIEALEATGRITPTTTIIEATSGNTGVALAFVCAAKGYPLILCMPAGMSVERRKMFGLMGATLELTPAKQGMRGSVARAEALARELGDAVIPSQFDNPANPAIHHQSTAMEILGDLADAADRPAPGFDVFVASVGTGGTITGVGRALREHAPSVRIVAVEPEDSAVLSGGAAGPHKIQGIGAGFVPENLDASLIDEVLTIGNETAFETARRAARLEGCPCGVSSGAALAAALEIGERPDMAGKRIVAMLPSFAERYLSTPLFEGL